MFLKNSHKQTNKQNIKTVTDTRNCVKQSHQSVVSRAMKVDNVVLSGQELLRLMIIQSVGRHSGNIFGDTIRVGSAERVSETMPLRRR